MGTVITSNNRSSCIHTRCENFRFTFWRPGNVSAVLSTSNYNAVLLRSPKEANEAIRCYRKSYQGVRSARIKCCADLFWMSKRSLNKLRRQKPANAKRQQQSRERA